MYTMRNSTKTKTKLWFAVTVIIGIIPILITITSLFCFILFNRTTATVTKADMGREDTIVYLGYEVDGKVYEKMQRYSADKHIKPDMTVNIWYSKSKPDVAVTVHDFLAYYILIPIISVPIYVCLKGTKKKGPIKISCIEKDKN